MSRELTGFNMDDFAPPEETPEEWSGTLTEEERRHGDVYHAVVLSLNRAALGASERMVKPFVTYFMATKRTRPTLVELAKSLGWDVEQTGAIRDAIARYLGDA